MAPEEALKEPVEEEDPLFGPPRKSKEKIRPRRYVRPADVHPLCRPTVSLPRISFLGHLIPDSPPETPTPSLREDTFLTS